MKKLAAALFLGITLLACSKPTIDTTTDETTQASMKKVRESLPEADRDKFDAAVQRVAFSKLDFSKILSGEPNAGAAAADKFAGDVKAMLHGKTGPEIIAMAERLEQQEREAKRAEALREVQELLKKRDASVKARAELAKFQILRTSFAQNETMFGKEPTFEIRVKNGTAHAISHVHWRAKLTSPGRSVPWHEDDLDHQIRGGIEPGEEMALTFSEPPFMSWGLAKAPAGAVLEATVVQLDGADGKPLFSTREFTKDDEERLAALQREYGSK